jgi:divalent metal cation (Fe/Co/Zn/Cd) transporter
MISAKRQAFSLTTAGDADRRRLLMRENRIERWLFSAKISIYTNIALAIGKLMIGILSGSVFLCCAALYNVGMAIAKRMAVKGHTLGGIDEQRQCVIAGRIITAASGAFIIYCIRMFVGYSAGAYSLHIALAIATATFAEIGISIYNIVAARQMQSLAISVIELTNLASALVSVVLTQCVLLSISGVDDMSLFNGISGVLFGSAAALIGIYIATESSKGAKRYNAFCMSEKEIHSISSKIKEERL